MKSDAYFMDDPREAERLASKVDGEAWVEQFLASDLTCARRILDVGCGSGTIAAAVARRAPASELIAVDISSDRIDATTAALSGLANASAERADACEVPFEDGRFNLVYCRLLLQFLPDRQAAVRQMARVCAPGGIVLLQDLDGQLLWHYPMDPGFMNDIEQIVAELGRLGFDPFVGRKLHYLAKSAGLQKVDVDARPYHLIAGRIDDRSLSQWELKLDIALRSIARAAGGEDRARRLIERFRGHLLDEETLTYSVLFTVRGRNC